MDVGCMSKMLSLQKFKLFVLCNFLIFEHESPADFPSNQQFAAHYGEFLASGYKSGLGNIDIRFNHSGDRCIEYHDVKFVDGQTKALIMITICSFCAELEFGDQQCQDPQLAMVLQSFVAIKCAYEHFQDEGDHFLYSLRCSATIHSGFCLLFVMLMPPLK